MFSTLETLVLKDMIAHYAPWSYLGIGLAVFLLARALLARKAAAPAPVPVLPMALASEPPKPVARPDLLSEASVAKLVSECQKRKQAALDAEAAAKSAREAVEAELKKMPQ